MMALWIGFLIHFTAGPGMMFWVLLGLPMCFLHCLAAYGARWVFLSVRARHRASTASPAACAGEGDSGDIATDALTPGTSGDSMLDDEKE